MRLFKYLSLICFLFIKAGNAQTILDSSNLPIEEITTRRQIPLKYGSFDPIHGDLKLNVPIGPRLPGRIPIGINWNLDTLSPVVWSTPPFDGTAIQNGWFQVIMVNGKSYSFDRPSSLSVAQAVSILQTRGATVPSDLSCDFFVADKSGTKFLLQSLGFWAYFDGENAYWTSGWSNDSLTTYVGNIWGDRVSISEIIDQTTGLYKIKIQNELKSSDFISVELLTGTNIPFTVVNGIGAPAVSGMFAWFSSGDQSCPDRTNPEVTIRSHMYTNGGSLASITMDPGDGQFQTTVFNYGPGTHGSVVGNIGPQYGTAVLESIQHPTFKEQFYYLQGDPGQPWQSRPAQIGMEGIGAAYQYNVSYSWVSTYDSYGWFFNEAKVHTAFSPKRSIGRVSISGLDLNGNPIGKTYLVLRKTADLLRQRGATQGQFVDPLITTTVLTYPTPAPDANAKFRGVQYIHPIGKVWWNSTEAERVKEYLLFTKLSVVQERVITGQGAPTADFMDPQFWDTLFTWTPSQVITHETRDFDGWTVSSGSNSAAAPLVAAPPGWLTPSTYQQPIATPTRETIRRANLPSKTIVVGSRFSSGSMDLYGPVRSDVFLDLPSAPTDLLQTPGGPWQSDLNQNSSPAPEILWTPIWGQSPERCA